MSNNKITNTNGRRTLMVDLNPTKGSLQPTKGSRRPTKNQSTYIPPTKSTIQSNKSTQSQSTSRKRIKDKDEVNLLEDSDSNNDNDTDNNESTKPEDLGKLTRLSYQDEKYKKFQAKKRFDPVAIYIPVEDIKEKLKFYKRVDSANIPNIKSGMRIKYIQIMEDGTYNFKPGGALIVNKAPEYVVLAGNRKTWSVQLATHILFVEQFEQIRHNYEQKIKALTAQVNSLVDKANTLSNKAHTLECVIKQSKINIDDNTNNADDNNVNNKVMKKGKNFKIVSTLEPMKSTKARTAKVTKAKPTESAKVTKKGK